MPSIVKMTVMATAIKALKAVQASDGKIDYHGLELTTIGIDDEAPTGTVAIQGILSSVCVPIVMTTTSCEVVTIPTTTKEVVVNTSIAEASSSVETTSTTEVVTSTDIPSSVAETTSAIPSEGITVSGSASSHVTLGGLFVIGLALTTLF
ncbi:hypothetical protein ACHAQA_007875 [Verticillium albo-atrum]